MSSSPSLDFTRASYEGGSSRQKTCTVCELPLRADEPRPMHQQICLSCAHALRTTKLDVLMAQARARRRPEAKAAADAQTPADNTRVLSMLAAERTRPSLMPEALAFGVVAAAAGCALYAAVEIATHWRIGYVAVAVGYMVGWAMRKGSRGEGGRNYQVAAALLTYAAVSAAVIPVALYRGWAAPANSVLGMAGLLVAGLIEPATELMASPVHGLLNLLIVFYGVRMAWRFMAVRPVNGRGMML